MEFSNIIDLEEKVKDVVESNNFGEDIQILSDFIEAPGMFLNYYMKRAKITDYSIFDVEYSPKFKTTPCDKTTFDFKININNNYFIEMSIWKIEAEKKGDIDEYKFQFRFMDEIKTIEPFSNSAIQCCCPRKPLPPVTIAILSFKDLSKKEDILIFNPIVLIAKIQICCD